MSEVYHQSWYLFLLRPFSLTDVVTRTPTIKICYVGASVFFYLSIGNSYLDFSHSLFLHSLVGHVPRTSFSYVLHSRLVVPLATLTPSHSSFAPTLLWSVSSMVLI